MIATDKNVKCGLLTDYIHIHDDYEILFLQSGRNVVSVAYRPPKGNFSNFSCFRDEYLQWITENNLSLVLGGDNNIEFLSQSTNKLEIEGFRWGYQHRISFTIY